MPQYTINIGSPTLTTGDHFHIRYRTYPGGVWQTVGDITANSFTIGLSPDTYQFEITYVLADGTECTPTLDLLTAVSTSVSTCSCLTGISAYITVGCDSTIKMNVTIGTPYPDNCGIRVGTGNGSTSLSYSNYTNANLPSSLTIPLISSASQYLSIDVFCCDTNEWLNCYNELITDIRECACTSPLTITSENITTNVDGSHTYCVTFAASSPDEPPYYITFYPNSSNANVFHQTVYSAGTYCFTVPSGIYISRGKWRCTIYNICGSAFSAG